MPSTTNQEIIDHKKPGTGKPNHFEMIRPEFSFDAEFSLPPGFFDNDFLDKYDICEPHVKESMQPENDVLRKADQVARKSAGIQVLPIGTGLKPGVIFLHRTLPFIFLIILFILIRIYG